MSELPAPLISLNQVVVQYGTKTALKEISLDIPTGRVTVSYWSQWMWEINHIKNHQPHGRDLLWDNPKKSQNLHDLDPVLLRRDIGYAIQSVGLFPHMDVQQNISVVPKLLGWEKERIDQRVSELLDLIGLNPEEYRKKYPSQLSGGESQRVGVARALAADPPILLMDEPFGAVDPLGREILQDEFVRIQRKLKKTIVFVTHDLEEAIRLADYLVIMKDGNIVQASTPEHLLAHPSDDFVRQFLGPDRALKRLTLYTADRILSEAITKEPLLDSPTPPSQKHWWILGEDGLPVSGNMILEGKRQSREIDSRAHVLRPYSSLKEGLSRILALGMPAAPVISDEGKLMGEIRYEDIQRLSYQ